MSAKAIVSAALFLAVIGGPAARAEELADPPPAAPPAGAAPPGAPAPEVLPAPAAPPTSPVPNVIPPPSQIPAAQAGLPPGSVPDPWITYDRPGCCGPIGGNGPIGWEYYLRTGVSIPAGNTFLAETLQAGWTTTIGARSLFFNRDTTAAWVADAGLGYTYNNSGSDKRLDLFLPFIVNLTRDLGNGVTVPVGTVSRLGDVPITVRAYHRASVNLSGGREWYLTPAYCPGSHWRFGVDVGGRYGASRLEANDLANLPNVEFRRLYDVYGAVFVAAHTDVEIPINACTWFVAGLRVEWDYDWSDVFRNAIPFRSGDLQDVNIMLNFGVRF